MRTGLLLLFLLLGQMASGQIINIETRRFQTDTTGWKGSAAMSAFLQKDVRRQLNLGATSHLQYKSRKNLYLFLLNVQFSRLDTLKFTNAGMAHLRFNTKLNKWIRWEAFTQGQYNQVTGIRLRVLTGTGPRFKVFNNHRFSLYAGTLYMYEYDEEKTSQGDVRINRDHRASGYLSLSVKPKSGWVELTSTTYLQPLLDNYKDFRLLNENQMSFHLSKHLVFSNGFNLTYDETPPLGFPREVFQFTHRIGVEF